MRRLTLKYRRILKRYGLDRVEAALDLPMLEIKHAAENGKLDQIIT